MLTDGYLQSAVLPMESESSNMSLTPYSPPLVPTSSEQVCERVHEVNDKGKMPMHSRKHGRGPPEADAGSQPPNKRKRVQEDSTVTIEYAWDDSLDVAEGEGTRQRSLIQHASMDGGEDGCKRPLISSPGEERCEDLNNVFVVIADPETKDKVLAMTPLLYFLRKEYMTAGIDTQKGPYYSYDQIRQWLLAKAEIPLDVLIGIDLDTGSGAALYQRETSFPLQDDADLVSVLTCLRYGVVRPYRGLGYVPYAYILVRREASAASPTLGTSQARAGGAVTDGSCNHPITMVSLPPRWSGERLCSLWLTYVLLCPPGSQVRREGRSGGGAAPQQGTATSR